MTGAHPISRRAWFAGPSFVGILLAGFLVSANAWAEPIATEKVDNSDLDEEAAPAVVARSDVITAIHFHGNRVTREKILIQEMLIAVGDVADPTLIEKSRQAIMNLGLFTSVRASVDAGPAGSVLNIYVKEKYYILPVPKLNRDDDNKFSLGAELVVDNLNGLNQQLKTRYETEKAVTVVDGQIDSYFLSFIYPRIAGSAWAFSSETTLTRQPVEDMTSVYEQDAWTASIRFSRWINLRGPSRGWQIGSGVVWRQNSYEYRSGPESPNFVDSDAVGIPISIQFIEVDDYLFSRKGLDFGYSGEIGAPILGSDTHYNRHEFYYRRYFLIPGVAHQNIDAQLKVGLSSGDLFPTDKTAYALGSSKTLRAYETGSITGNAYALLNVQYLAPLFGYHPLRGVIFADVGNAYPSNTEMHLGKVLWDVGVGIRLRLKSFVKIDLRVDAAWNPDTGGTRVFAGTRDVF